MSSHFIQEQNLQDSFPSLHLNYDLWAIITSNFHSYLEYFTLVSDFHIIKLGRPIWIWSRQVPLSPVHPWNVFFTRREFCTADVMYSIPYKGNFSALKSQTFESGVCVSELSLRFSAKTTPSTPFKIPYYVRCSIIFLNYIFLYSN